MYYKHVNIYSWYAQAHSAGGSILFVIATYIHTHEHTSAYMYIHTHMYYKYVCTYSWYAHTHSADGWTLSASRCCPSKYSYMYMYIYIYVLWTCIHIFMICTHILQVAEPFPSRDAALQNIHVHCWVGAERAWKRASQLDSEGEPESDY